MISNFKKFYPETREHNNIDITKGYKKVKMHGTRLIQALAVHFNPTFVIVSLLPDLQFLLLEAIAVTKTIGEKKKVKYGAIFIYINQHLANN